MDVALRIAPLWPALATHPWAYPALEVVHITGIALLVGNLAALELRVFGVARALPVAALARLSLGLATTGFAIVVASGLLMFGTNPAELLSNRAFTAKIALIALAGLNAAVFHVRGSLLRLDSIARWQAAASLLLWIAVIACGRWIAYR